MRNYSRHFSRKRGLLAACLALLSAGSVLSPALAVRYTQVFPNAMPPATNVPSGAYYQVPASPQWQYRPQVAPPSNLTLEPVRVVQYASQPLQSPQAILDNVKAKDGISATVAPKISVENSNTLNAATDGQNLIITSALLEKLHTNDQRAFVISHELSHILLSHVAKTQMRRVGLSLFDQYIVRHYVAAGSLGDLAARFGIGLVDTHSSRGFEYQADDLGVRLMSEAGYNPEAAIQVFDILKANTPPNQTPGFLMDHPITDDRIKALVKKYKLQPE